MKKKLHLIRHSYAENPGNGVKDFDRKLTLEGQSTVRALGRHLKGEKFDPDIILCSTAERTRETALYLIEELEINEHRIDFLDIIYNASIRELLGALNEVSENHQQIAIIGHNPAITFLGEYLSAAAIGNMQPASIVSIEIEKLKWSELIQGVGIFKGYYHPSH